MVNIFINWMRPKTFSPIVEYNIAYGGRSKFFLDTAAFGTILKLLPVSSAESI